MNEMMERAVDAQVVASKKIVAAKRGEIGSILDAVPWVDQSVHYRDECRAIARAVLAEIRTPTNAMLTKGATWGTLELDGQLGRDFTGLWQAMIDAALK